MLSSFLTDKGHSVIQDRHTAPKPSPLSTQIKQHLNPCVFLLHKPSKVRRKALPSTEAPSLATLVSAPLCLWLSFPTLSKPSSGLARDELRAHLSYSGANFRGCLLWSDGPVKTIAAPCSTHTRVHSSFLCLPLTWY